MRRTNRARYRLTGNGRQTLCNGVLWADQFLDGQQRENRSFSRVTIASRLIPIGFRVPAVYLKPAF